MRSLFTALLFCASLSALAYFFWYKPKFSKHTAVKKFVAANDETAKETAARVKMHATALGAYAKAKGCNTDYCFLVDMKLSSGKKRFFVYNLMKDSVEISGLVTHGSGKTNTSEIQFSNTEGSLCSSLGKYKIGNSYTGKFGLAYKLYGLDATNSNAASRYVVLHSHACVPIGETDPFPICESWGCPTVAPAFLSELAKYIDKPGKPVLLSIYK
ncbi:MAG: murein L,D-transpeptidase catalytic domain family protein [Ferruginibacter sp.]